MTHKPPMLALLALAACGLLSACASDPTEGYALASAHSEKMHTVHVPVFANPTFHRGIEVDLTDALIKEIQRSTPWKVTDASVAETALTGAITDVNLRRLSTARDSGLSQEVAVVITVDFDWKDARTGRTMVARRSFSASETFVPTRPVGERLEVGEHAAVQQLAKDIVTALRSEW